MSELSLFERLWNDNNFERRDPTPDRMESLLCEQVRGHVTSADVATEFSLTAAQQATWNALVIEAQACSDTPGYASLLRQLMIESQHNPDTAYYRNDANITARLTAFKNANPV